MRTRLAATQMACSWNMEENLATAERLVRKAAQQGANVILLQEMFATHFFAFMDWKPEYFKFALPVRNNPILQRMSGLAKELGVVLPVNFFERANNAYYNTIMMIDDEGRELGIYRKSHIPMGPPGCFEKVYTSQGDTGFKVWKTRFGNLGVGVCWDQWFPESARCMCVMGADFLFYPTGIGSDCHDHWQITMQGHAAANLTPLVASNRIGQEFRRVRLDGVLGPLVHRRSHRTDRRQGGLGEGRGDHRRVRHRGNPRNESQLGNSSGIAVPTFIGR